MTTGTGIAISMMMYLVYQAILFWISCKMADGAKRPAATEARIARIENVIKDIGLNL